VTVYGIVIVLLLLFPWMLVGVQIAGAAVSVVRRGLAQPQKAGWVRGRGDPTLPLPQTQSWEHLAGRRAANLSSVSQPGPQEWVGRVN
jgi:hypothetical protein